MNKTLSARKFISIYEKVGILAILLIEITVFAFAKDNFLTVNNLFLVARQVSFTGIAAVGMTMVLLVGEIDISVGSILAFTGCLCATLMTKNNFPMIPTFLIAIAICGVFGLLTGTLTAVFRIPSLIATLAMQTIIKGCTYLMTGGASVPGIPSAYKFLGQGFLFGVVPVPVIVMLLAFLIGFAFLNKTYLGRRVYAVGGNKEAARLSGIRTKAVVIGAFVASAVTAGIAGILMAARLGTGQPSTGADFAMDVLTAVVLGGVSLQGGKGSVIHVFVGSLIIGILSNGLVMLNVLEYWQWIIKGIVFLLAVAMSNLSSHSNN